MKDTDFIDASGYLRVQEKRLLSGSSIDRVIDANGTMEVLRMLSQNTDYDFGTLGRPEGYEPILKEELARVYALGYSLAKEHRQVVDIPGAKYDYHNIKTALKAKHFPQRTESPYYRVTAVKPEEIEALVADPAGKTELPDHLVETVRAAEEAFLKSGNPQDIDIATDKRMFRQMLALCAEIENEFITGYVEMAIDFYNIKTLMRVKDMQKGTAFLSEALADGGKTPTAFFVENYGKAPSAMVPVFYYKYFGDAARVGIENFEKSGNFSDLERALDNLLIAYTKKSKYLAYGAEVLFSYLLSKENEIRQIRIIVTCKQNQIGPESLRERLRDNYA